MKTSKPLLTALLATVLITALPIQGSLGEKLPKTASRPWKVVRYLSNYQHLAIQLREIYGIPMAVTFAVAGLESDFGLSSLAINGNNHFGIKNFNWNGAVYCQYTSEWMPEGGFLPVKECFRKYPLIADSYLDFALFLASRPNYRYIFNHPEWDYSSWVWQLQAGGYATDPNYASKLLRLIEQYQLYLLDQ
jgi:flagellum-specific peptidoglycan hydrolase FlgJ